MNYQRKRILFYSLIAVLFTILLLLLSSGFSSSGYLFWGSAKAPSIMDAQSEVYASNEDNPAAPSLEITPKSPLLGEDVLPIESSDTSAAGTPKDELSSPPVQTAIAVPQAPAAPEAQPTAQPTIKPTPPPAKASIPVLNYHSVTIDPGNIVVISPAKLEEQMAHLHENGYTPLTLQSFISIIEGAASAPEKPVLLTFDDGYTDNYENALPVLAKYAFPATLFISPGMIEDDYYLNWEQIKKLQEAGWDIQPHGMTHPHLPKLSADQQTYEILEARKQIEEKLGTKADIFCYPYGEFNKTTLKLLQDHGFRYAFTIEQGYATDQQPPYLLKRLFINGEENLTSFIRKLPKN